MFSPTSLNVLFLDGSGITWKQAPNEDVTEISAEAQAQSFVQVQRLSREFQCLHLKDRIAC